MAGKGKTLIFPRNDTIFKKKESLPFDEIQSLVWVDRPFQNRREHVKTWFAHLLVGISVGTVAFLMTRLEEYINEHVIEHTQKLISDDNTTWFTALIFYAGMAALFAMMAGLLTTYYGPGASGSGVAELIGYMNGINYPDFIGINTLITKAVGVTFAVTGKLCVGKEGPLAHIGAIVGLSVLYIPGLGFEFLRNEDVKRQFIAAGASAGVSAAFGAPIGGALFCYEMSKPNTFWKFTMIWKVFFSCSVGNLTLAILTSLSDRTNEGWNTAALKFGNASYLDENDDVLILLPGAIIIGVLGGLIGPLFINLNTRVNVYRKKYLTSSPLKVIETAIFGFATAGVFFILPYLFETCNTVE